MQACVESSLYRNGKVLTRRDSDGSDGGTEGVDLHEYVMPVSDSRALACEQARTLEYNGFELLQHGLTDNRFDFFDHNRVIDRYYGECADAIKLATGAHYVFAFDHNIRSASGKEEKKRLAGGQQVQGPAHLVHGDYTLCSAPQRLRDLSKPPSHNDTLRGFLEDGQAVLPPCALERAEQQDGRFAIINLWRNITTDPVMTHPLALCDARTVEPQDLVVFEIHYADRIGENYFSKHSARHHWYYYPHLTRDEALLIKQWDSAGTLARSAGSQGDANGDSPCTFSFHSAFFDPQTPPHAPDRCSIEVRCIVIY